MNKKTKILISVLAGVALCVVAGYAVSNAWPGENGGDTNANNSTGPADMVEVVYFHRTNRCAGCIHEEELTRYTLETYFADELDGKKLTFQSIDVQDSSNAAIVNKYGAYARQLFINAIKDGTDYIEQATDLYPLIFDDEAYIETLKSKIERCLNGEA